MTRTIMTAAELDALPVGSVVRNLSRGITAERLADGSGVIPGNPTACPWDSLWSAGSHIVVLHDPSAPAVPVVSDAAVSRGLAQSAAGETVDLGDFTQYLIPDAAIEVLARHQIAGHGMTAGSPDICRCGDEIAPEPLDVTQPLPTGGSQRARDRAFARHQADILRYSAPAAPSATREEVSNVALAASSVTITDSPHQKAQWLGIADALLARFTITPRTDR